MRSNRRRNWFIRRIALGFAVAAFVAPAAQARGRRKGAQKMRSNRRRNWLIKRIALGLAIAAFAAPVAQAKVDEPPGAIGGRGAAAVIGAGWDLWTDTKWAVGLAARGMLGQVSGSEGNATLEGKETSTVLLVGLSASVLLY